MPHFLSSSSIASQIDEEKNTCCSVWFERSGEIDDYTAIWYIVEEIYNDFENNLLY